MGYKVYNRKGAKSYKTKKLMKELSQAIGEKYKSDPNFKFEPATTEEELKSLHNLYCPKEIEFEEVKEEKTLKEEKPLMDKEEENTESFNESISDRDFIDPFNRDEPLVRDYVLKNEYAKSDEKDVVDVNQTFEEPKSEKEAFDYGSEIEDVEDIKDDKSNKKDNSEKVKSTKQEPINPSFDTMSNSKKKRSTKRFAKNIVNAVVSLAEKGFVWFANKDISEAKIVEYEMTGEIDLGILLDLGDGNEATVKQFFANQRIQAEYLSKIDDEIKNDLVDALTEVMLEKGIAPTPIQELAIVGLNMVGSQAIVLMGISAQNKSVLNQLRVMQEGKAPADNSNVPPVEESNDTKNKNTEETTKTHTESVDNAVDEFEKIEEQKMIGGVVETKE